MLCSALLCSAYSNICDMVLHGKSVGNGSKSHFEYFLNESSANCILNHESHCTNSKAKLKSFSYDKKEREREEGKINNKSRKKYMEINKRRRKKGKKKNVKKNGG